MGLGIIILTSYYYFCTLRHEATGDITVSKTWLISTGFEDQRTAPTDELLIGCFVFLCCCFFSFNKVDRGLIS